jgi:hypothetical protein
LEHRRAANNKKKKTVFFHGDCCKATLHSRCDSAQREAMERLVDPCESLQQNGSWSESWARMSLSFLV